LVDHEVELAPRDREQAVTRSERAIALPRLDQRVVDVLDWDPERAEHRSLELRVVDDLLDRARLQQTSEGGEISNGERIDEVVRAGGPKLDEAEALVGQRRLDVERDEGLELERGAHPHEVR